MSPRRRRLRISARRNRHDFVPVTSSGRDPHDSNARRQRDMRDGERLFYEAQPRPAMHFKGTPSVAKRHNVGRLMKQGRAA